MNVQFPTALQARVGNEWLLGTARQILATVVDRWRKGERRCGHVTVGARLYL